MKKTIVYVVAGMSSRFQGKVKQLAEVGENGETFIEISIEQAIRAGFNNIIFVIGKKTEVPFREKFGNIYKGVPVKYATQEFNEEERDKPWGTTDAICSSIGMIDSPFVFCNGDDLYGENSFRILSEHIEKNQEDAAIGYKLGKVLPDMGETNRGIFQTNENFVSDIKEVFCVSRANLQEKGLTEESLCSMNLFVLQPSTLDMLKEKLDKFKRENKGNRKIESLLPQDLSDLIKKEDIKMRIYPTEDEWIGITNPGDEIAVREFLKKS